MADPKPNLSMKRAFRDGEWVQVGNDQLAFPEKPPGSVPDGEHLSAIEKLFLITIGRWCHHGNPCERDDLEIAEAMALDGDAKARRLRVQRIINGRWVGKTRWPGLCDPSRGFITRVYRKGGRNARRLYTTAKWEKYARAMHRLVVAPQDEPAAPPPHEQPAGPELHPAIREAATIAEQHIRPPLVGQAVAEMIRGDHRWSRLMGNNLDTLPRIVWMAANRKPGSPFGFIRKLAVDGFNDIEAEADRLAVLKRDEPRPEQPKTQAEPTPPPTAEELETLQKQYPSLAKAMARLKNSPPR